MRIAGVVQARMGSSRLPGKVLRPLCGKPMLEYLLERLQRVGGLDTIVVATSTEPSDDSIEQYCADSHVRCVRGPASDVAARFVCALDACRPEAFVRICADSPLLDPRIVEHAMKLYSDGNVDIVTNKVPRTYPAGQSVEIVNAALFRESVSRFSEGADHEHVTPFFYRHQDNFRIRSLVHPADLSSHHMAVDTLDDFERCSALIAAMDRPHVDYALDDLVRLAATLRFERAER